jgi:hypothetical protein
MNLGQLIHKHYLSLFLFNIPFSLMLGIVCIMQEQRTLSHEACDVSVSVFLVILMAKDLWSFVLSLTIFLSSLLISKICKMKTFCSSNSESALPSMFSIVTNALLVYSFIQGTIILAKCGSKLLNVVQCFVVYQILFSILAAYRFLHENMLAKELNSPTTLDMQKQLKNAKHPYVNQEMKEWKIEIDKVRHNLNHVVIDNSPTIKQTKKQSNPGSPTRIPSHKSKDLLKPLLITREPSENIKV